MKINKKFKIFNTLFKKIIFLKFSYIIEFFIYIKIYILKKEIFFYINAQFLSY